MATIISASIDLSKIDKSKIIDGKNGAKYYNLDISVNDDFDKYNNNVSVTDKQTKEQREAKDKKTYLGNGRVIWSSNSNTSKPAEKKEEKFDANVGDNLDLPF